MAAPSDGYVIIPVGGLGNQLFIYAAGLALATEHNVPLYVDRSWYHAGQDRKYELDSISFRGQILDGSWKPAIASRIPYLSRLLRGFDRSLPLGRTYQERGFMYDPTVDQLEPGSRLGGYFQSPKYFSSIREKLLADIWAADAESLWYRAQLADLGSQSPWIALHVRRGDYTSGAARNFHGILERDYYQRALNALPSEAKSWPLVIFSDDDETAHGIGSSLGREFRLATAPEESRPIETLLLMGRASAFVCANSSFSWWGAWLGHLSGRRVVAPRPWFRARSVNDRDLLLPEWFTVGA